MADPTTHEIGATLETIASLPSLGIPGTQSEFIEYARSRVLADGTTKGIGFPQAVWYFGFLTADQFETLREYATSGSGLVYIATMTNAAEFIRYSAIMTFPQQYEIRNDKPQKFEVRFTHLIEAEE